MPPGLHEPLVFSPYCRPQVWGGRRLADVLHKPLPNGVAVGESWELSAQPLHVSRVAEGPWAGVSLLDLWNERPTELMGEKSTSPQFPWLIKWLDCHELLSVQVHPDDAMAQQLLGEPYGKTESWVVVQAEPTARIYAGLKSGVTREDLRRRSQDGTVAECLHSFVPSTGDCVHIPAGTVHAVGGGVLMAEVQQSSDATFRLFDWNRIDSQGKSRELHLERALDAIDFHRGPVEPRPAGRAAISGGGVSQELLVRSPYYDLERITLEESCETFSHSVGVFLVQAGTGLLTVPDGKYRRLFQTGETVLIPACVEEVSWEPVGETPVTLLSVTQA